MQKTITVVPSLAKIEPILEEIDQLNVENKTNVHLERLDELWNQYNKYYDMALEEIKNTRSRIQEAEALEDEQLVLDLEESIRLSEQKRRDLTAKWLELLDDIRKDRIRSQRT